MTNNYFFQIIPSWCCLLPLEGSVQPLWQLYHLGSSWSSAKFMLRFSSLFMMPFICHFFRKRGWLCSWPSRFRDITKLHPMPPQWICLTGLSHVQATLGGHWCLLFGQPYLRMIWSLRAQASEHPSSRLEAALYPAHEDLSEPQFSHQTSLFFIFHPISKVFDHQREG